MGQQVNKFDTAASHEHRTPFACPLCGIWQRADLENQKICSSAKMRMPEMSYKFNSWRTGIGAVLVVIAGALAACTGGSRDAAPTPPLTSTEDDVFTGGGISSPDGGTVFVPFDEGSAAPAVVQASLRILQAKVAAVTSAGVLPQSAQHSIKWFSQFTTECDSRNGYCAFASMLMGATYLDDTKFPRPSVYGYNGAATGAWMREIVDNAFSTPSTPSDYLNCGGDGLGANGRYPDFQKLGRSLGVDLRLYQGDKSDTNIVDWIARSLNSGYPVMAQVPYQGKDCSGMTEQRSILQSVAEPDFYQGGAVTRELKCLSATSGHQVLVSEIGADYVKVYDPDPYAINERAGIRRYSRTSFLLGLRAKGDKGTPVMFSIAPAGAVEQVNAFALSGNAIELVAGISYDARTSVPIASSLVTNAVFSATGMPLGLALDTEARVVGSTSATGDFDVSISLRSTSSAVSRYASKSITITVKPAQTTVVGLEFVTPSTLNRGKVGGHYLQAFALAGGSQAATFNVQSGNLPLGLALLNGQLRGIPTQAGEFSVDVRASTPIAAVVKTFRLVVDPAALAAPPATRPVLSGITPPIVTGSDNQQTVVFDGLGLTDGTRIELVDQTNGGTYMKSPVSVSSQATGLSIRANFTMAAAEWTATAVGTNGQRSEPLRFSVVSPTSLPPVISTITPNSFVASSGVQSIVISGANLRPGVVLEVVNYSNGFRETVLSGSTSPNSLLISYAFSSAGLWSVRAVNSDGSSSASIDIFVSAPVSVVVPQPTTLTSPGASTSPGPLLSDSSVVLNWIMSPTATAYSLVVRDVSSSDVVVDTIVTLESYTLALPAGKAYRWTTSACNVAGCSVSAPPMYFQIRSPTVELLPPTISSLSETSMVADSTDRLLRVIGSNFANGNVVVKRTTNPASTSRSSATLVSPSQVSTTINPGSVSDTIYIKVCQSSLSSVCTAELPIAVTAAVTTPDLQVLGGALGATSVTAGGTLGASWTISNLGSGAAAASTTVVRINQSTTLGSGTNLATVATNALAANGTQAQSANLTAPTTPGTYYVWVLADNNGTAGQSTATAANDIVRIGSFTVR